MVKEKNKIWAIIPARSGSKGIKNKNIVNLSGKPLIYYTIKDAFKSKKFEKILVLTDSQKYAKIAKSFGAEVPYLRPKSNALDTSTDNELYIYMLDFFREKQGLMNSRTAFVPRTATFIASNRFIKSCFSYLLISKTNSFWNFRMWLIFLFTITA